MIMLWRFRPGISQTTEIHTVSGLAILSLSSPSVRDYPSPFYSAFQLGSLKLQIAVVPYKMGVELRETCRSTYFMMSKVLTYLSNGEGSMAKGNL